MTSKAPAASPVSKSIDAYVHYTPTDSAFAHQTLGDGLRQHYSLHFHHCDDGGGGVDASSALEASSRVILVASNDYMLNDVAQDELRTILERMRGSGRERGVIVVVLTDSEKKHLKRHFGGDSALVRWNDPSFWKKLRFHLPEPSSNGVGDQTHLGVQTAAAFGTALAPRPRGQSDYEDDMWTYMKGAVSGSQQSHSSGGQDSSLSTRSTTDNSGTMPPPQSLHFPTSTTLSMAVMGSERTAGTTNGRRRPPVATHSLRPGKSSVSPPGARLVGGTHQRRSASRRHIVENPLEDEYMSVVGAVDQGSLARRHGVNPPLPEPIYHTLEPPSSPNEDEVGSGLERQSKRARRKKKGQGDGGNGNGSDTVYINRELEVVYPRRGDLRRPSPGGPVNGSRSRNGGPNASFSSSSASAAAVVGQQRQLIQMLQNVADFEEDEYADQEDEELLQSELDFDTSGGQNSVDLGGISPCGRSHLGGGVGGYVPSPAPGSMPRRPSGKLAGQHSAMSTPRGRWGGAAAATAGAAPVGTVDASVRSPSSNALAAKQAGYYI